MADVYSCGLVMVYFVARGILMNFAVIGTNFVTDWFLEAGELCEDFSLIAVYSRTMARAKEYAGKHGAKYAFDSLDDVCRCSEIDAVYVASPTSCHCAQSIKLMNAGKHVLCEKPIASNLNELMSMLKCAKENNVVLLEAMRPQFSPALNVIENTLEFLGEIRYVNISFNKYSSRYDRFLLGEQVNTFNPKLSNGALTDLGCYCIHILHRLFGEPLRIQSSAVKLKNGIDVTGAFIADYTKMMANISYSKVSDTHNFCEIQGEQGTLQFRDIASLNEIYLTKRGCITECIFTPMVEQDMLYELQTFIKYTKNQTGLDVRNHSSISVMRIMDEVRRQVGIVFPADKFSC